MAGFLSADRIEAGSISTSKVTADFGGSLVISNNPSITDIQAQIEILPMGIVSTVKKYGRTYIQLTDPTLDDDKLISLGDYWIVADPDDNYIWGDAYEGTFEDFYNIHNSGTASGYKDIYCWNGTEWIHVFDTALVGESYARITQTNDKIESEVARINAVEGALISRISQEADKIQTEVARSSAAEGTLSSRITQTASEIRSEVTAANGTLSSRITQTASEILAEVTAGDGTLASRITQTASEIRSEVTAGDGTLASRITQTASEIRSEVTAANGTLSSRITQTASEIQSEVTRASNSEGTLSSRITQTASEIRSEVSAANGTLSSRITQTATSITSLVAADTTLSSRITQTATSITTLVAADTTLSSRITQTATSITSLVAADTTLSSRITQTATSITSLVAADTTLSSRITQTATSITSLVAADSTLSSRITQTASDITAIVEGTTAAGALSTTKVTIGANGVDIASGGTLTVAMSNFAIDADGNVTCKGAIDVKSGMLGKFTFFESGWVGRSGSTAHDKCWINFGDAQYAAGSFTTNNMFFMVGGDSANEMQSGLSRGGEFYCRDLKVWVWDNSERKHGEWTSLVRSAKPGWVIDD